MFKVSQYVPQDLRKVHITLDHHQPSLCGKRNTKSGGVTLEAQLQLRVKFYLGDELTEVIIDQLDSCEFQLVLVPFIKAPIPCIKNIFPSEDKTFLLQFFGITFLTKCVNKKCANSVKKEFISNLLCKTVTNKDELLRCLPTCMQGCPAMLGPRHEMKHLTRSDVLIILV